jgi:D-glycero-D-manno-heptose 1,7-bisphosphate phosphatase
MSLDRNGALVRSLGIDLTTSVVAADRWRDIVAGKAAGCYTVFDRGYAEAEPTIPDALARTLPAAVDVIMSRGRVGGNSDA